MNSSLKKSMRFSLAGGVYISDMTNFCNSIVGGHDLPGDDVTRNV